MDQSQESDCEMSADGVAASPANGDLSSYNSKAPLMVFCEKMMGNKFTNPLTRLAAETHGDRRGFVLDLTKKSIITTQLKRLAEIYDDDIRKNTSADAPAPAAPATDTVVVGPVVGTVVMSNNIMTETQYKETPSKIQLMKRSGQ